MTSPIVVLVTGAGGQLGQELVRMNHQLNLRLVGLDRNGLDVTNRDACMRVVTAVKPDIIIHAAAYTAVDMAESEPEMARLVNVDGTHNMAEAAESVNARFCYVSTDYVFDGKGKHPYYVDDMTGPCTVYGSTKLEGELAAQANCTRTYIVRTSWVYGAYGSNFVKTMLKLAKSGKPLRVVDDQVGSPTYTYDLAKLLIRLVQTDCYGVYHASGGGSCSWYQFAQAIFELCDHDIEVYPCLTEDYPRPASRPAYSVLDCEVLQQAGLSPLRYWQEALVDFLQMIKAIEGNLDYQ